MLNILKAALGDFRSREQLAQENLLPGQQIIVLERTAPKPKIRNTEHVLFAWLSQTCQTWKDALTTMVILIY